MKLNKGLFTNFAETVAKIMIKSIDMCKSATGTIDELKSEKL